MTGITLVGTTLTGDAVAQGGGMSGGMSGGMYGYGGPVLWLLILLVIGGLVYLAYTRRSTRSDGNDEVNGALSILREQYARGELSEEEFEKRRERLERTT